MKPGKREFHKEEVKYLGLIIGIGRVKMDFDKLAAVQNLLVPHCTFNVQLF